MTLWTTFLLFHSVVAIYAVSLYVREQLVVIILTFTIALSAHAVPVAEDRFYSDCSRQFPKIEE